jgi:hypothetical protein
VGSIITPMMFSDTPAFFNFTRSAGVRSMGLFCFCRVLTIKPSDIPDFTSWITESTCEGGFAAAAGRAWPVAAGFGAAAAAA